MSGVLGTPFSGLALGQWGGKMAFVFFFFGDNVISWYTLWLAGEGLQALGKEQSGLPRELGAMR